MRGKIAVIGVGETRQGKLDGSSTWDLYAEAAKAAIIDAGIDKNEIDGLITCDSFITPHSRQHLVVAQHLGLRVRNHNDTSFLGGDHMAGNIRVAAALIEAGLCKTLMVVAADNLLSGSNSAAAVQAMLTYHDMEMTVPFGILAATNFALIAQRYMHEYGWTSEQFAQVAVNARKNAALHPGAVLRTPLTVEQVLASPMISTPFHRLDFSMVSDGGCAVIVTSAKEARQYSKAPVYVLGTGGHFTSYYLPGYPDLVGTTQEAMGKTADEAFNMAGLRRADIDVAGIPDMFTPTIAIGLAGCGFVPLPDAAAFAASDEVMLGGSLPVNLNGGHLAYSHPGIPGQGLTTIEVIRQLRGECGVRQIKDAELGYVQNWSGPISQQTSLILGNSL